MSRYFFHLRDARGLLLDEEGRELEDMAAVTETALVEARSLIGHDAFEGRINLFQTIEVHDATGKTIHQLSFFDAVTFAAWVKMSTDRPIPWDDAPQPPVAAAPAQNDN